MKKYIRVHRVDSQDYINIWSIKEYTYPTVPAQGDRDHPPQCKPLNRRNSIATYWWIPRHAFVCTPPPPRKNHTSTLSFSAASHTTYSLIGISLSRDICLQGEGEWEWNTEIAVESVNRSLFRWRKGLHWLLRILIPILCTYRMLPLHRLVHETLVKSLPELRDSVHVQREKTE